MSTGFEQNGVDEFDTEFEPYTAPFGFGILTNYTINNLDINQRYLALSSLADFHLGTKVANTNYQTNTVDIKNVFAALGSVNYTITVPVTQNTANLNVLNFVKNYLQSNYPAFYDTNYSFFNNNFNQNGNFSATNPSIILKVNSGVVVYSNDTSTPAMTCGGFPSGVFIEIKNLGHIVGCGGVGGTGSGTAAGGPGESGGIAISMTQNVSIDNGSGFIYGGGGGGGAGGPAVCQFTSRDFVGTQSRFFAGGHGGHGATGAGGTVTNATGGVIGAGPLQGSDGENCTNTGSATNADFGGDGGAFGSAGNDGYGTAQTTNYLPNGSGGNAGKAVAKNGHTLTWIAGSTSPHVLGAVS